MDAQTAYDRRWIGLGALCLSLLVVGLDNTILNVALPRLADDLHATTSQLQWIVDGYTLVFAGLLLTTGSLGDRYGRRSALSLGLLIAGLVSPLVGRQIHRRGGRPVLATSAAMLGIGEDACRQRVHRAKQRLREDRPRQAMPNIDTQRRLLERFMQALQQPDMPTLRALFAEDALSVSDGGGLARATLHPLHGAERLARLYMQIGLQQQIHGVRHELGQLNGTPALFSWHGDTLISASWIDDDGECITAIHSLRHPGKLARLAAVTKSVTATSLH